MIKNLIIVFVIVMIVPEYCSGQMSQMPYYSYPYDDLHVKLKQQGVETIKIFSYGSLMDVKSASTTLSTKTLESLRPAVAFGVKRLFDRDVAIKPNSKWGQPKSALARGMLNVIPSDKGLVNGVVFTVAVDEIPQILYREEGYDLLPVVVKDWNDEACYMAYTFSAPKSSSYTSDSIDPRPGYYELTRNASAHFGPQFYEMWFETTYQSDGMTPIGNWEEKVRNKDPHTQMEPSQSN